MKKIFIVFLALEALVLISALPLASYYTQEGHYPWETPTNPRLQFGSGPLGWITIGDIADSLARADLEELLITPHDILAKQYPPDMLDPQIEASRRYRAKNPTRTCKMSLDDEYLHGLVRIRVINSTDSAGNYEAGRRLINLNITHRGKCTTCAHEARHVLQSKYLVFGGFSVSEQKQSEEYSRCRTVIGYPIEEEARLGPLLALAAHYGISITPSNMEKLLWAMVKNDFISYHHKNGQLINLAPLITFRNIYARYFDDIDALSAKEKILYVHEKSLDLPGMI